MRLIAREIVFFDSVKAIHPPTTESGSEAEAFLAQG